jgi:predicted 3-demethylubiquinone-9 3-methyltransferase (glyoxalase superfamily)
LASPKPLAATIGRHTNNNETKENFHIDNHNFYLVFLKFRVNLNNKIMTNKIYPCLWFDGQAQAAAKFYCTIFKNSKITADNQMVVTFELDGKKFMGLNGGPNFKFNEAVSFVVECETQEEIDHYWNSLTADGGQESNCGWLKDKFGMSWQIVPTVLPKLLSDPTKAQKVMKVYMGMKKFDIKELENA